MRYATTRRRDRRGTRLATIRCNTSTCNDCTGAHPNGGSIEKAGVFYGVTLAGGPGCGGNAAGTVFELKRVGGSFQLTTLHVFQPYGSGGDGYNPNGPLLLRQNTLYGTTLEGGAYQHGAVYQIVLQAAGRSQFLIT